MSEQHLSDNPWLEAATAWEIARSLAERHGYNSETIKDYTSAQAACRERAQTQSDLDALPMLTYAPYAGRIDLRDPAPTMIDIRDIARVLSRKFRFNGVSKLSVGAHSLIAEELSAGSGHDHAKRLQHLLHDGSEAYLTDLIRPIKRQLPAYRAIEAQWESAIFRRFGALDGNDYAPIDNILLAVEIAHQFGDRPDEWTCVPIEDKAIFARMDFYLAIEPEGIETLFVERYAHLANELRVTAAVDRAREHNYWLDRKRIDDGDPNPNSEVQA